MTLPKPEVLHCVVEKRIEAPLSAMELDWSAEGVSKREWHLPDGVVLTGAPPARFGIEVHRFGKDSYGLQLLWNRLNLNWHGLTRREIMASCLPMLLRTLGTDLGYLLEQPIEKARAA